ncbi:beta-N-acetylglucosaminidase [Photobacterium aquae]|uniref:beta-N-acetylhexosaminidase n=1 Tax=Photobacterium aquae TaxID=1195763 RepID=A0A0J1H058_9GAMM|nr:family 20 glycosylhydrolase [Photobacterium aquae]KLV05189.1 beta-N-acetylglucosaminidase [Photobacterium aquae]
MKWKASAIALAVSALCSSPVFALSQQSLNQYGDSVALSYTVVDNTQDEWRTFRAKISLNNQGATALPASGWAIWFSHIRKIPTVYSDQFVITHINGDIFKLEPTAAFKGLPAGQSLDFEFDGSDWQAARTDIMPNWYFVSDHEGATVTALIQNTSNRVNGKVPVKPQDELAFVSDFTNAKQWKRYDAPSLRDAYDPFTAEQRFERNANLSHLENVVGVVPAPAEMSVGNGSVTLDSDWVVVYDAGYEQEAAYLAEQLGITAAPWSPTAAKVIKMGWGQVNLNSRSLWSEAYKLNVDPAQGNIKIAAADAAGAFYAAQSLLQLVDNGVVPAVQITDAPRFDYRGFSLDSSRNFRDKETVLRLLDQMARFKLNKLHLRLADDEGWRIEIASLPELTEIGSHRCYDPEERRCLLPFLGAGPDGTPESNGYYTAADYREILAYAKARNIEVIPELDMPGHAHAAVKAMEARYHRLMAENQPEAAAEFLLTDFEDKSDYLSVQMFKDNAMNICMESTFSFVDKVTGELAALHQGIQPLKTFHFGGDEVAGAWKNSPACQTFFANNDKGITSPDQLSQYFVERVAAITANHGLNLGGWEDGLMHNGKVYPRAAMANAMVRGNAWQNIWEWGVGDRAYNLANNGFKVIYNHATHFYFDHPYEPDPNERGYYWAPRYTDTRKTFGYMPDDVFANADFTRAGAPITKEEVVASAGVKKLERPENVAGLQSSLWAETVRTSEQFEGMVFPRIIAMAERAWHTAEWEANDAQSKPLDQATRDADYNRFANLLGQRLFDELEADGIDFNLPVPGAKIEQGILNANSPFPGLAIEYSDDNGANWQVFDGANPPAVSGNVLVRTVSGERTSRIATVK